MAITIRIRSGETAFSRPPEVTFDGLSRVVLGRGATSDIRLPDPTVSHRHATVERAGTGFALRDEGSTNGTFVGGIRIEPHTTRLLRSGDVIRLGNVWVEIGITSAPVTRDPGHVTRDLALRLVEQALQVSGRETRPGLLVVEGPDQGLRVALQDGVYVLGRSETADIPVSDPDVSRQHAEFFVEGDKVEVTDLGSKNGVLVHGQKIPTGARIPLARGTAVRFARTVLTLDMPVEEALLSLEALSDEVAEPPLDHEPPKSVFAIEAVHVVSPTRIETRAPKRRKTFSFADWIVFVLSAVVLSLSVAGFYWLLRG